MLPTRQTERTIGKFKQFQKILEAKMFVTKDSMKMEMQTTHESLHHPPQAGYTPAIEGQPWGQEWQYCWLKGQYTVPEELHGRQIFLRTTTTFREALIFVEGTPYGIFTQNLNHSHGKHYCSMIDSSAMAGKCINLAIEAYAGHNIVGTQPFSAEPQLDFKYNIGQFLICVKDELICDAYFTIRMVNELVEATKDDFRRAELINAINEAHAIIYYSQDHVDEELFRSSLSQVTQLLKKYLQTPNGENPPMVGIIGHSHLDTAWLWPIDETIKKCARTLSNAIVLMKQYPEYKFIQSSAYHGEWMRRHYPILFREIQEQVTQGRYEPNGGVWVECDCNITSGEFMIRQFLWGQNFTRQHFGYTSNVFWLPDTFGYSSAMPQIMKGCGVDYFMTTKIEWNDTNHFPYDSFYWKGLDGTAVFSHFNRVHVAPSPPDIIETVHGTPGRRGITQKEVTNMRFLAFGFGDGGGGPDFEMVELARRSQNTKGMPRAEYLTAGEFMQKLEQTAVNPNIYKGELYLEFHRGTFTSIALIKRQNRKAEQGIRDAELCIVRQAIMAGKAACGADIRPHVETTLVNQFHDILPGTSIPEVNRRSFDEMGQVIAQANKIAASNIPVEPRADTFTAVNTLSFPRDSVTLPYVPGKTIQDEICQQTEDIDGNKIMRVANSSIPSMGSRAYIYTQGSPNAQSPFIYNGSNLETPFASICFDNDGYISSFIDKRNNRQIKGEGYSLNAFLMAEDVTLAWENWDIDADHEAKLEKVSGLIDRQVISDGAVEFRIRSRYKISESSTITQDMIFHAHNPRVDFETKIHWNNKRRLLKTAFDTNIYTNFARQEIQFGFAERPTTRNNSLEAAKFETLNHKFSDLSEPNYGVSILNDCKYGISIYEGSMRLTLLKGGTKPDPNGDEGVHYMTYSLLPHMGGFSAKAVTHQAYDLNYPPIVVDGYAEIPALVEISVPNVILETVKPCEKAERAFIARFYECEGGRTVADISFNLDATRIEETNMLEETIGAPGDMSSIEFGPFEIKTFKVYY